MEIWKKMWVGVFFWTQCIVARPPCPLPSTTLCVLGLNVIVDRSQPGCSWTSHGLIDWLIDWLSRVSSSQMAVAVRRTKMWSRTIPQRWRKKSGEHWSTNHNCRTCEFGPTQVDFFRRLFHPLALAPQILTRTRYSPRLLLAQTTNAVEVP